MITNHIQLLCISLCHIMSKRKENDRSLSLIALLAIILIVGLWYLTYFLLKDLQPEERGTLGDMFGTVNALFSGLAFAGIIITILLQRKELKYQRDELRETRAEFIIQNKTLKNQRFENTFFNLLELHNEIVNAIDYVRSVGNMLDGKTRTIRGRDVFEYIFNRLNSGIKEEVDMNKLYLDFYDKNKTDLGHYFRNLYRIFKLIHETEFATLNELDLDVSNEENKKIYLTKNHSERYRYTSIVRAQLSDYELLLLFYNCLSEYGNEKFKPLIEEYSLLKNLPTKEIKLQKMLELYKSSAYNKNKKTYA